MKIYIASGFENRDLVRNVWKELSASDVDPTYDWTLHDEEKLGLSEIGRLEIDGVRDAVAVVVILPGFRGTHTELGAALVSGKRVLLCFEKNDQLLDRQGQPCPFYEHSLVEKASVLMRPDVIADRVVAFLVKLRASATTGSSPTNVVAPLELNDQEKKLVEDNRPLDAMHSYRQRTGVMPSIACGVVEQFRLVAISRRWEAKRRSSGRIGP